MAESAFDRWLKGAKQNAFIDVPSVSGRTKPNPLLTPNYKLICLAFCKVYSGTNFNKKKMRTYTFPNFTNKLSKQILRINRNPQPYHFLHNSSTVHYKAVFFCSRAAKYINCTLLRRTLTKSSDFILGSFCVALKITIFP